MINAILGGVLIGLSVSLMLLFNGRVTGISGIVAGIMRLDKNDISWRAAFILGLVFGGFLLKAFYPQSLMQISSSGTGDYIFAGLLVGFGTVLGNGCTSGHGVCGISRFSVRSILSTVTFIFFGILSVIAYKALRGEL
ncbi:MAG: YeeE/YedE family protein [Bacteriovoracaceae bacterium]|nr:YeeE/YedE family protein [Bacteriovoracaceae bacterium]